MLTTLYLWNDNNTTETTFVPSGSTAVASAKSEIEKSRSTVAWSLTSVAWPFSNFFQMFERPKTLFDSWPTVAWTPTTVVRPLSDFFQKFSKLLETCINVVWHSADGHVTSDHNCRVTVQRLFSKCYRFAWNVEKNVVWQSVGRRSHNLQPLMRDRWATFFKISLIAWYIGKTLFESQRTVAWLSGYFATVFVSYGFTYPIAAIAYVIYLVFNFNFSGGTQTFKICYLVVQWK